MRWYYKYGMSDWVLLPIAFRAHNPVVQRINKPSACAVPINRPLYEVLRQGLSAVPKLLDGFEDMDDGDDLDGRSGYTVTIDEHSTCKAETTPPTDRMEGTSIKVTRDGTTSDFFFKYTFPTASPQTPSTTYQYWVSFDLYTYTGTGTRNIVMVLNESSFSTGGCVNVKIGAHVVYARYSGSYADLGMDIPAGPTLYHVRFAVRSASTYDVELTNDKGVVYAAYGVACNNNFTGAITDLAIGTEVACAECSFHVDNIRCSWDTETVGWDENNTDLPFMKVVVTPDGVTAADLNGDFDACTKLAMYKVTGLRHAENNCYLDLEEWHAQLWREVFTQEYNVHEIVYIGDITDTSNDDAFSCVTVRGGSTPPSWSANQHVGRGVYVVAAPSASQTLHYSSSSLSQTLGGGSYGSTGAIENVSEYEASPAYDNSDHLFNERIALATSECRLYRDYVINCPRFPEPPFVFSITYVGTSSFSYGVDAEYVQENFNVINQHGGSNQGVSLSLALRQSNTPTTVTITISGDDALDFYDEVNERFVIRIDGGTYSYDVGVDKKYHSDTCIFYLKLTCGDHYQHDPVSYVVESNTASGGSPASEITIVDTPGYFDTATNHINHDDEVNVVFFDEEWMEDYVIDRALDIGNIHCASTAGTVPQYGLKLNKPIRNDITTVCDKNTFYNYLSRVTANHVPDLHLVDRASPTFIGGRVYPVNMKGAEKMPVYGVNFLERVRSVIVDNTSESEQYPTDAPSLGIYPPVVSQQKDVPDVFLSVVAQGKYEGRSAVGGVLQEVYLHSIYFSEEDFMIYNDGEDPTVDNVAEWVAESGDDGDGSDIVHEIDVTDDVHSLHVLDNSRTKQTKISHVLPVAIGYGNVLRIKYEDASATSDVSANCFLALQLNEGSDVGAHLLIAAGGQVYHKESDADQTTVTGATDTSENLTPGEVRYLWVHLIDKDTYKIKVTTDETAPSSWSATLTMPDDIDVGWDTIRVYTPDANDDGGEVTDTIDEDFESYTVGNSIIGGQWSWVVGPAGTSTMKCAAGKVGQLIANGGRSQVLFTFPTASANTPAAGVSVSVTVVGPQSGASNGIDVFIKQNATGPVYGLVFQTDGKIYDRDSGGTLNDTGATWSGGSTYIVTFEVVDDTHHKVYINTVDKGSFTNWASTNGKVIDGVALDTYDYATAGNYATTVDIDNITGSWTSGTVYTTKAVEAYIYELWSDVLGAGNVQLHDIPPEYFHVGMALDFHFAPTTKNGTDYQKHVYRAVIKELEWLDEHDCARIVLGFDDASRVSIEEAKDKAFGRLIDPTQQG